MTIMRRPTSPFGELLSLRQAMDRLFEDSFVRPRTWLAGELTGGMPLDIYTTKDSLVIKAALPGVKPENVDITIEGNTLTIAGRYEDERKEEGEGGYLYQELSKGSCSRTVTLPAALDADRPRRISRTASSGSARTDRSRFTPHRLTRAGVSFAARWSSWTPTACSRA